MANEIFDVVIAYDVSGEHPKVKAGMLKLGYTDNLPSPEGIIYLPNTTLHKNDITLLQAYSDLKVVVDGIGKIYIQRAFACSAEYSRGMVDGKPHSED